MIKVKVQRLKANIEYLNILVKLPNFQNLNSIIDEKANQNAMVIVRDQGLCGGNIIK